MLFINIINEIFRALPLLSSIIFGIIYFITKDLYMFYIFIGTLISGIITDIFKNLIFKYIEILLSYYNFNTVKSILGTFERPCGAKNCGNFYINETNFSYTKGMPSGHCILAGYLSIYMYYYIINKYKIDKKKHNYVLLLCVLFIFYIMHTRILFGCHTLEQTIVGGIIGMFLGHYYYLLSNKIINK